MKHTTMKSADQEVVQLHESIITHMKNWSRLETSLSKLLYDIIRIKPRSSKIPYVIYYSPDGFDARQKIVDRAFRQFIKETPTSSGIENDWNKIDTELTLAKAIRNKVAHGAPLILGIRGKYYVRHSPPAHDVNRVGNLVENGIPGISASEILTSSKTIINLVDCIEAIRFPVIAYRQGKLASLTEKLAELATCLQKLPNRHPIARKSKAPPDQPQSSPG